MTILSLPGRNHNNRYFSLFCEGLEQAGMKVVNIRDGDAKRFKFDVLHIHLPTHFITETKIPAAILWSVLFVGYFLVTKLLRKSIVYTVHNVLPFNTRRKWLLWPYLSVVHRLCDGFVFLNQSSQAEFYSRFPSQRTKRFAMTAIGPYPTTLLSTEMRANERLKMFGSPAPLTLGFLGNIKSYKSLDALEFVPPRLSSGRPVRIVVAGRIEKGYGPEASAILARVPSGVVLRIDKALSDAELDDLIQCVDVVLLPYTRGWNSSAALLVLSNRGRILSSNLPMFRDLENELGRPWIYCYDHRPGQIADSLKRVLEQLAIDESITQDDERALTQFLTDSGFAAGARKLRFLYNEVRIAE